MANLNKVMLIGRLTRDPEAIAGNSGAKFGFAVNNRRYNQDTKQWDDVPVFLDMEIWNRGESKQADRVMQTLRKGQQVFIEGHLKMDQWDDKNGGGKRSAIRVVVENFQYLEARGEGGMGGSGGMGGESYAPRTSRAPTAAAGRSGSSTRSSGSFSDDEAPSMGAPASRGGSPGNSEDDIPF
ncbi:MAG: single-stranded DNA-binding protein [Gemmataceae bacterium]